MYDSPEVRNEKFYLPQMPHKFYIQIKHKIHFILKIISRTQKKKIISN